MDAFETAARAEADRQYWNNPNAATTLPGHRGPFTAGAEWARAHYAEQEPTDAEVEVLARMTTEEVSGCGWETFSEEARNFHRESARRRLTAARKARA